ncbi:MAG: ribonuclease III [Verrucomicrobiota bacterium]|nr:ribonuclease III [Verrucomicrobiota bacterium]
MDSIEKQIDYNFLNPELLTEALTHPSFAEGNKSESPNNQRLEFLGDAVLQLVLTHELFSMFPEFHEGHLSKLRARLVSNKALEECALEINLGSFMLIGRGVKQTWKRDQSAVLSDAFEALIGAIYLDSGFDKAKIFILRSCKTKIDQILAEPIKENPKTKLQEHLVKLFKLPQMDPTYHVIKQEGPGHNLLFETEVRWNGITLGSGKGKSKKESEQSAAQSALDQSLWLKADSCE